MATCVGRHRTWNRGSAEAASARVPSARMDRAMRIEARLIILSIPAGSVAVEDPTGPSGVDCRHLEPTLADLEIATFAVDEVVEGTQTGWSDGRLTLALPQLAVGAGSQPALAEATVEVVRPGDFVRISNGLDVVLPVSARPGWVA